MQRRSIGAGKFYFILGNPLLKRGSKNHIDMNRNNWLFLINFIAASGLVEGLTCLLEWQCKAAIFY
jgi:hypothetical protein